MASYNQENDIVGGGYGFGGGGGMFAMIILLVVVFWTLFRRDGVDGHRDGFGAGFPGMWGSCGPCVQPTFKDESNFEEERNINSKLCKIDEDVWRNGCKDREATHCEGEKTRALIEQNYIQDLRDKLAAAEMEKLTLKQEMFTEKKFDQVLGAIGKLDCECVKRPPVWAECRTPNAHDIDCREGFGRRGRGRCNDFDDFCCA